MLVILGPAATSFHGMMFCGAFISNTPVPPAVGIIMLVALHDLLTDLNTVSVTASVMSKMPDLGVRSGLRAHAPLWYGRVCSSLLAACCLLTAPCSLLLAACCLLFATCYLLLAHSHTLLAGRCAYAEASVVFYLLVQLVMKRDISSLLQIFLLYQGLSMKFVSAAPSAPTKVVRTPQIHRLNDGPTCLDVIDLRRFVRPSLTDTTLCPMMVLCLAGVAGDRREGCSNAAGAAEGYVHEGDGHGVKDAEPAVMSCMQTARCREVR